MAVFLARLASVVVPAAAAVLVVTVVAIAVVVAAVYYWCSTCPSAVESRRRARDSRAPPVEGGADGCDARALSAQPTAMKSLQIHELPLH